MIESLILFFVCVFLAFCLFVCVDAAAAAADGQVNSRVRDHQVHTISAT